MWKNIVEKYKVIKKGDYYFIDCDEFLKKYKNFEKELIYNPRENSYTHLVIKKIKFDDFLSKWQVSDASKWYLEHAKRGNAFIGVGDIDHKTLHIHPLVPDNNRTMKANNDNDLTEYIEKYPKDAFINMPIIHRLPKDNDPKWKININCFSNGGTSHGTLLGLINEKKFKNKPIMNTMGFAVIHTGEEGDKIKMKAQGGLFMSAIRNRSNFLNHGAPEKYVAIDEGKYLYLCREPFNNENEILDQMLTLKLEEHEVMDNPNFVYIPLKLTERLSRKLASVINENKSLKNSLKIFSGTDVFTKIN